MEEKRQYREMINILLDDMRMETVSKLLKSDVVHQRYKEETAQFYEQYQKLELSDATKYIIDGLLNACADENLSCCINSYLAGLLDSVKIGKEFGIFDKLGVDELNIGE